MQKLFLQFLREEKAATAIEYGFIASMIAVAIVGALLAIGPTLSGIFSTVKADL